MRFSVVEGRLSSIPASTSVVDDGVARNGISDRLPSAAKRFLRIAEESDARRKKGVTAPNRAR